MAEIHYSITQLQDNLANVLHLVEDGNAVELTRNGETVAVVVSIWQYHQLQPPQEDFWQAFQAFRQEFSVAGSYLEDDLFSGLRDRGAS